MAPWIAENLPPHEGYLEPFCGGARVLFAKSRAKTEVINDLDGGVVAAIRAARDHPDALAELLELTPYARSEHAMARAAAESGYPHELLEAARLFLVLTQQQMFAMSAPQTWRQPNPARNTNPQRTWANLPAVVRAASERLQGVAVECRPALDVIDYMDHPEVVMYLDPPYHPGACDCSGYRCTMTKEQHQELADVLSTVRSMVVLSGYQHEDYARWYEGWHTLTRQTTACTAAGAGSKDFGRTEVLWFNEAAWARRSTRGVSAQAG